ncbi:hypothetical protein A4H97_14570 [Niastella yeongjuensis]|uniref:DUF4239 domain-containing protein n=1 Tax=Niastella yeongjuensis TaxID=354355 RepID=A0A1V9E3Y1_9BACT|nr:hypothetical protein [Niastella yeongjuensis]OQP40830.1 hypothetical protein A4H97_14570 [Niastella yeongjuensis]SEP00283.1 hypothetical protein SAMN05660816_04137 [Niastella yeongjuensis]
MDPLREKIFQVNALLIAAVFFIIIYVLNWLGYVMKKKMVQGKPERDLSLGTAEGALMGLMALLLAFTFGMASSKYESRRQTIIDEANLLNTALFRIKLYPDSIKKSMLGDFKKYLDARIDYWDAGDDPVKINAALNNAGNYFNSFWNDNALLINDPNNRSRAEQLVPVLINMKNMVTTREAGRVSTVPSLIILVLLILVFVASFLTGFGLKPGSRNPVFSIAFTIMLSVALYIIMELSRPRQGLINLGFAEKEIVDVRKNF